MQLTAHTDYALRVLIYLAQHPEKRVTIDEMAEFFNISRNHLVKVVHNLGIKGFIRSVRGKGGGLYLARPAEQIRIGDVVRGMEGHFHVAECFNPKKRGLCTIQPGCGLIPLMGNAVEAFLQVLDARVLSDVLPVGDGVSKLKESVQQ